MKKILLHKQFKNYRQEVIVLWSCYKFHKVQLKNGFTFIAPVRLYYFEGENKDVDRTRNKATRKPFKASK